MQSAKDRSAEYEANRLDGARNRGILVQGQVRALLIVVIQIRPQQMTEMTLAKDNHVVNALSPDRPDQPHSRFAKVDAGDALQVSLELNSVKPGRVQGGFPWHPDARTPLRRSRQGATPPLRSGFRPQFRVWR
jgi:hypothetical protein